MAVIEVLILSADITLIEISNLYYVSYTYYCNGGHRNESAVLCCCGWSLAGDSDIAQLCAEGKYYRNEWSHVRYRIL